MVGHVNLEEQVDADFSRTRRSVCPSRRVPACEGTTLRMGCALLGRGQRAARGSGAGLSRHEDGAGGADPAANRREAERA